LPVAGRSVIARGGQDIACITARDYNGGEKKLFWSL